MNSRTISNYRQVPFIRLLIPFCLGIILQWYLPFHLTFLWKASIVILAGCFLYSFTTLKFKYKHGYVAGFFYNLLITLIGMILISSKDIRNDKLWIGNQSVQQSVFLASIISTFKETANAYKTIAEINGYYRKEHFFNCKGKVIIYFSKKNFTPINTGSKILFDQQLTPIANSGNPECFDFKKYCLFQGITHQVYLNQQNFTVWTNSGNSFASYINTVTEKIVHVLKRYIPTHKESGLAEAMMIGYKDDLDKTLLQSYTDVGVVHIIAISGMHLALIYALLIAITFPSNAIKKFIWWRVLIILLGIWYFSLLTGFQPSILRAGIMLTSFVLGKSLFRKTSSLNSLAFSAFVLLCYNPFWLWDIGFQLSYLAVASIMFFYKPILQYLNFQNKLMQIVWKAVALTLAAQILTTPVSIFYFHQFPRLFLISNLIAVPLSSLILLLEIILMAASWLPLIAGFIGKLVYATIFCLDEFIIRIQNIPDSIWKGLYISLFQCILIYIFIFCIAAYIKNKNLIYQYFAALCIICFCMVRISSFLPSNNQHKLIVYNIPGHQVIQVVDNKKNWIITNGLSSDNYKQSIEPYILKWRLNFPVLSFCKQFQFAEKKIAIIDLALTVNPTAKTNIDFFILSKNSSADIKYFLHNFYIHQIILDSSVPDWKAQLLKAQCDSMRVPCFYVSKEGAFIRNL